MLTFTGDCSELLIANEGRPGRDVANVFKDPEGTINTLARQGNGSPSERNVKFSGFENRRGNFLSIRAIFKIT